MFEAYYAYQSRTTVDFKDICRCHQIHTSFVEIGLGAIFDTQPKEAFPHMQVRYCKYSRVIICTPGYKLQKIVEDLIAIFVVKNH